MTSAPAKRVPPDSIAEQAAALFARQGFPGKETESWRHTLHFALLPKESLIPSPKREADRTDVTPLFKDGVRLTFVDGIFSPEQSRLPSGGGLRLSDTCLPISDAEDALFPLTHANALHAAREGQGVALTAEAGAAVSVAVDYVTTRNALGAAYTTLTLVAEPGSSVTVTERHIGDEGGDAFHSHASRFWLKSGASCRHYRIQQAPRDMHLLAFADTVLEEGASYRAFSCHLGARVHKQETSCRLAGKDAYAAQDSLLLGDGRQHHDIYLPVLHDAQGGESRQKVRQALRGRSTCVYYGRVDVPMHALGTNATQMSRNMLLSPRAKSYSRPELHILTDDVACSHGAATGRPDEDALYYLESRGIGRMEALSLLLEGFLAVDEESVPDAEAREHVVRAVKEWTEREDGDV
jgi:Fe-S cluster assembly protein SufD